MTMTGVQLQPTDTLFFGSGVPFSADDAQEDISGVFPPYPPTMVGAMRAWLARSQGWPGHGPWASELHLVLGADPNDLGTLDFSGSFLMRDGAPVFRAPRHLLGTSEGRQWHYSATLRPGPPVRCDLGDGVRLPMTPGLEARSPTQAKTAGEHWLTLAGLEAVLHGRPPEPKDMIAAQELWREERRIGLERDSTARTALAGRLYSARHIRLQPQIGLGVRFRGVPNHWRLPLEQDIPFGGESRVARCLPWDDDLSISVPHAVIAGDNKVTLIGLTPLDIHPVTLGMPLLAEQGGVRVISACIDRPLRIGGWSTLERRSLPLRSVLAPGSVLFCEANEPRRLAAALEQAGGLLRVGLRQQWGFGLITIGTWTEHQKDKSKR